MDCDMPQGVVKKMSCYQRGPHKKVQNKGFPNKIIISIFILCDKAKNCKSVQKYFATYEKKNAQTKVLIFFFKDNLTKMS